MIEVLTKRRDYMNKSFKKSTKKDATRYDARFQRKNSIDQKGKFTYISQRNLLMKPVDRISLIQPEKRRSLRDKKLLMKKYSLEEQQFD